MHPSGWWDWFPQKHRKDTIQCDVVSNRWGSGEYQILEKVETTNFLDISFSITCPACLFSPHCRQKIHTFEKRLMLDDMKSKTINYRIACKCRYGHRFEIIDFFKKVKETPPHDITDPSALDFISRISDVDMPSLSEDSQKMKENGQRRIIVALSKYPGILVAYKGSWERYKGGGTDSLRQSLDSARNALENLQKELAQTQNLDETYSSLQLSDSQKGLFRKTYQWLNARGVHGSEIPLERDCELGLRLTEDLILWLLKFKGII